MDESVCVAVNENISEIYFGCILVCLEKNW